MGKKEKTSLAPVERLSAVEQRLKKSVGAIHSSGNLTLVQRKLANVLLYSAYDNLLSKRTHTIPVPIMCAMLGWEASNRIDHLKEALAALQETRIEFNLREDGHEVWESMTMLSYAHIKNGVCTYRYDEALAERLYDPAMFALINLKVQRQLDTAYALNLYENLYRFRHTNTGSTGEWSLAFFREIIGATASYYDDYRELNRKIIKPSLLKINQDTDIQARMEPVKKSRHVVGLKFFVQEKTEEEKAKMPNTLPGTSLKEEIDTFAEVRATEAFQALLKHGITERLSFAWIREKGEQAVLDLVAYTEERDANKQIKTNTGAYMKGLIAADAKLGKSAYQAEKEAALQAKNQTAQTEDQKKRLEELKTLYRNFTASAQIDLLTQQEKRAYAKTYIQEVGEARAQTFHPETVSFSDVVEQSRFRSWLRKTVAPEFDVEAFKAWVVKKKRLSLKELGL